MARTYTELYYHFVWATKGRDPSVLPEWENAVYGHIRGKAAHIKAVVHAINGMPDHVHVLASLPVTLSIADFVERVKGASSHFINEELSGSSQFHWQAGYSALTLTKQDVPRIAGYIAKQKQHHAAGTVLSKLERLSDLDTT